MTVYKDTEHLYECLGALFDRLSSDPKIGPKLRASNLVIEFNYSEPDARITAVCDEDPPEDDLYIKWHRGSVEGKKPIVTMAMKADIAHRFWLGKVNLLQALTRKQMIAKGPIPKILKLLPAIKPAYKIYPELLKELGYEDMI